jgi:protein O-GlcNAc transferase
VSAEVGPSLFQRSVLELGAGRLESALALVTEALQVTPQNPTYHCNRGLILYRLRRYGEAAESLYRAAKLKPDLVEASFNLGLVLEDSGKLDAATLCFERACDLAPEQFPTQYRYARALRLGGEPLRALGHYQCALGIRPGSHDVMLELGEAYRALRRFDVAERWFRRVIAEQPSSAAALSELGSTLLDARQLDEAIATLQRAVEMDPSNALSHFRLGNALKETADLDRALGCFRRAVELAPDDHLVGSNLVYLTSFHAGHDAAGILREARAWAENHAAPVRDRQRAHSNSRDKQRRLRIGYVSPDFRDHCQSLFTLPVFRSHDRARVEVYAYASVEHPDAITSDVRNSVDVYRDVRKLDDDALAERVRADGIDVLVDLTLHMADNRLPVFARKPAPVQICWLAYPGTTGLPEMDYRITDRFLDPPGSDLGVYSERSLVVPDTFWCYDPGADAPAVAALPAKQRGYVTFGCFNTFCKVGPDVIGLWSAVLRAVPQSRMMVSVPVGKTRERVLAEFANHGVEAERIDLVRFLPRTEYLARYGEVDICLDTVPYNGHTTSLDAFYMGVPVVTLVGGTLVGRAGLCLAENLDLRGLVGFDSEGFTRRAVELSADLEGLEGMRRDLRERMRCSALMDAGRFTRNLEDAYRQAWCAWCDGGVTGAVTRT